MEESMIRFAIVFAFVSSSFASPLNEWKLTSNLDNVKVWMLKSNQNVTGALQTSSSNKKINWGNISKDQFFKNFESNKKRTLLLIGVRDWQATSYKWNRVNDAHELVVVGTYIDPGQQKTSFKETQIYKSQRTYQILNTWPTSVSNGEKLADEFVQSLRKETKER